MIAIYTCPMHPQIRQSGPGNCPICGMALEPEVPTGQENESEIWRIRNRFWIALALAAPVVVLAMTTHLLDLGFSAVEAHWLRRAELLLSAPSSSGWLSTTTGAVGWASSTALQTCTRLSGSVWQ
jgi:P-type Cu+ transporter